MKEISAKKVLFTSLSVDIIDIISNLCVALITGSIVMTAETIQGFTDLLAVGLLLIGLRSSNITFLISSIMMLSLTAFISFYLGITRFIHPEPVSNVNLAIIVLIIAILTNGWALSLDIRRLSEGVSKKQVFKNFFKSPHLETKNTFVLDLIGILSASSGLISLILLEVTGNIYFDGLGAMLIGLISASLSFMLFKEAIKRRSFRIRD